MLTRDPLAAANSGQRSQDRIFSDAIGGYEAGRSTAVDPGKRQQQVFRADIVIPHAGGIFLCLVQHACQFTRESYLRRCPIDLGFAL